MRNDRSRVSNMLTMLAVVGVVLVSVAGAAVVHAQNYRLRGVTPIFDGWEELADKSRLIYFGYINRNSTETIVLIGAANGFDGGQPDRGQPTSFFPGRQEHVFTIKVPADFSGKLVWTLNTEMGTQTATGSLNQLYMLEQRENASADARPPQVTVTDVTARVGEKVRLTPSVKPAVSGGQVVVESAAVEAPGLNLTWNKHRGPGDVVFSPVVGAAGVAAGGRGAARGRGAEATPGMFPVSCGSKPGPGCGEATASFSAPGVYMLRLVARQDGMEGFAFLRVTVNP